MFPPKCGDWSGGRSLQIPTSLQGQKADPEPRQASDLEPGIQGQPSPPPLPRPGGAYTAAQPPWTSTWPGVFVSPPVEWWRGLALSRCLGCTKKKPPSCMWFCFSGYESGRRRNKAQGSSLPTQVQVIFFVGGGGSPEMPGRDQPRQPRSARPGGLRARDDPARARPPRPPLGSRLRPAGWARDPARCPGRRAALCSQIPDSPTEGSRRGGRGCARRSTSRFRVAVQPLPAASPPPQWYGPDPEAARPPHSPQTGRRRVSAEEESGGRRSAESSPCCGSLRGPAAGALDEEGPALRRPSGLLRAQSPTSGSRHPSSRLLCPVCPPSRPEGAHPTLLVWPRRAPRGRLQPPVGSWRVPFPDADGVSFLPNPDSIRSMPDVEENVPPKNPGDAECGSCKPEASAPTGENLSRPEAHVPSRSRPAGL